MDLLFFSDQWDEKWRRRQQLAWRLGKALKAKVVYVEFPLPLTSLLKYFLGFGDSEAAFRWRRTFRKGLLFQESEQGVWVVTPTALTRQFDEVAFNGGYVRKQIEDDFQKLEVIPAQSKVIVSHPFWSLGFYKALGIEKIDVYDCTEDFSEVYHLSEGWKATIRRNNEALSKASKAVTCVTQVLVDQHISWNANTHLVPNATDLEAFEVAERRYDFRKIFGIEGDAVILGYVGGVNKRFDVDLMAKILVNYKTWHLIIAGTTSLNDARTKGFLSLDNVHCLGQVPYKDVPRFLKGVDICVLPHKVDALTESQSSMKLYDYIASGKPIVSTFPPGVLRVEYYRRANSLKEWVDAINMLSTHYPAGKNNCPSLEIYWGNRVDQMVKILG